MLDEPVFEETNPSMHEVDKAVRVLSGERLKYTIRVHFVDGRIVEWQSNDIPKLDFNNEDRALWLTQSGYGSAPCMRWEQGAILLMEENPK